MRLVTVLACIAAVLSCAWAEDVVCKKRTKTSVQVGDGESFSFKTQAGREYKPNSRCIVKYKKSSSCPSMRFSCSKFSLKARNPSCTKGGDKMLVVMDGKKANRFCQGNPPSMTTTGDMQIVFISNRASQSSGAECSVECVSGQDGTPGNTGPVSIQWFYSMDFNTTRCVAPGMTVTFNWQSAHNVNQISKEAYGTGNTRECNLKGKDHGSTNGPYHWTAPAVGDYYFACGLDYDLKTYIGGHCKNGNMNAHILVSNSCK